MTGSRGPVSKPDDRRQRRNKRSPFVLGPGIKKPKHPDDLLDAIQKKWDAFWKSDVAKTMREEHLPMIERLFTRYDERERAMRVIRKDGRLAKGSQGQMVLHPLMRLVDSSESAILQLEDRLGISPRSRAGAGGGEGAGGGSLDDVNRRLNGDEKESDAGEDETDPRVIASIGR